MYSDNICAREIANAQTSLRERGIKLKLQPLGPKATIERAKVLQKRFLAELDPKRGGWPKLSQDDQDFIRVEIILCKLSFRHWAERYGSREIEGGQGGGHGVTPFWPSQERALEQIAKREEECELELKRSGFTTGIRGVWNKTRQQGATALLRLIIGHRMATKKHMRAIAASLDDDRVDVLYNRDKIWLDNLPFYLKPQIKFDEKSQHIMFDNDQGTGMKSSILYQMASQKAGIGVGQQFDLAHFTEVSKWPDPWRIEGDFMPTVAKARSTFLGWESTPWGRGEANFWYVVTEAIRKKEEGYEDWIYVFTPHYINSNLNRLPAPEGWDPDPVTREHAELVERTSPEWTGGSTIRMSKDQLYWWESKYKAAAKQQQLHVFFTDYPATPEQGFQHAAESAFPIETIDWLRTTASSPGVPYYVQLPKEQVPEDLALVEANGTAGGPPSIWVVGRAGKLLRMDKEELDSDPRGIFWIWELPRRGSSYIMGMDVSFGITGWNRYARTKADRRTDNGTVEILRVGRGKARACGCPGCRRLIALDPDSSMPDHLVAEFAAPVDPEDLGLIANILGRVYAGDDESGQAKCIMEVTPGPGKITMKAMMNLGYSNQWMWIRYADFSGNAQTQYPGWSASNQSNRDLWVEASRHINRKKLVSFSPGFAEECADALYNQVKYWAECERGHDDRMRAGFLALWAGNSWQMGSHRVEEPIRTVEIIDPQRSDMSMEEISDYYNSVWDRIDIR